MTNFAKLAFCVSLAISATAYADEQPLDYASSNGSLSCIVEPKDNISTVIYYVNGISNDTDEAEKSRTALSNLLGSAVCPNDSCAVKKIYNSGDGPFDDFAELAKVSLFERDAVGGGIAFTNQRLLKAIQAKFSGSDGLSALESGIKRLTDQAYYNSSATSVINFTDRSQNTYSKWVNSNLEDLRSQYPVLIEDVQKTISQHADYFNNYFDNFYYNHLYEEYMSNAEFYKDNTDALGQISKISNLVANTVIEDVLAGKKVVLVAHSQGNHVVELAYSILKKTLSPEQLQAVSITGIASVASHSPNSNNITWNADRAAIWAHRKFTGGSPIAPNFTDATSSSDVFFVGHNFINVYLNDNLKGKYTPPDSLVISNPKLEEMIQSGNSASVREWTKQLVLNSLDMTVASEAVIEQGAFITATINWSKYPDIDLHTIEPNGNDVYFGSKTGEFGMLDHDDTDGDGPEHYSANVDCDTAKGKTWQFGVVQYPYGGSDADVAFNLKLAGKYLHSTSYHNSAWPHGTLPLMTVKFNDSIENNKLGYKIILQ